MKHLFFCFIIASNGKCFILFLFQWGIFKMFKKRKFAFETLQFVRMEIDQNRTLKFMFVCEWMWEHKLSDDSEKWMILVLNKKMIRNKCTFNTFMCVHPLNFHWKGLSSFKFEFSTFFSDNVLCFIIKRFFVCYLFAFFSVFNVCT